MIWYILLGIAFTLITSVYTLIFIQKRKYRDVTATHRHPDNIRRGWREEAEVTITKDLSKYVNKINQTAPTEIIPLKDLSKFINER